MPEVIGAGSDPADDEYPDKPLRMRWATYNRLMDRLVAADSVTDELFELVAPPKAMKLEEETWLAIF